MGIDSIDCSRFGQNLQLVLHSRDMSQASLAASTGLSTSTISDYACGKRMPGVAALLSIAASLDISVEDLVDGVLRDAPSLEEAVCVICAHPERLSVDDRLALAEAIMTVKAPR